MSFTGQLEVVMAAMRVVSGRASNVSLGSDFSYAATNNGPVPIKNQLVSMRLDNVPVLYRTRTLPSIGEGDQVAAAGTDDNGTLEALAVRNLTTGAMYCPRGITSTLVLAGLLIAVGIPLIALLGIGLFFIGFGAWVIWRVLRVKRAVAMLREHGAAVPAAGAVV